MFTKIKKWIQYKIDVLDEFIFMEGRCQSEAGGFAAGFSAGFGAVQSTIEMYQKQKEREDKAKADAALLKQEQDRKTAEDRLTVKSNMTSAHQDYLKKKQEILANDKIDPKDRTKQINELKSNMLNIFNANAQFANNVGAMDAETQGAINGIYQSGEFEEDAVITDKNGNSFYAPKKIVDEYNNRIEAGTAKIEADGTIKFTDMSGDTKQEQPVYKASKFYMGKDKEQSIGTGSVDIVGADGKKDIMSKSDYYNLPENKRPDLWDEPSNENKTDFDKKLEIRLNYLKTLEENKNKSNDELLNQASEDVRNTSNERADKALDNKRQFMKKKYNVESVYQLPLDEIKKTGKGKEELNDLYLKVVKNIHGDSASKIIEEASKAIYGAESLYKSGAVFADSYEKNGNDINFLVKTWDRNFGSFLDLTLTDDRKIEAGKYVARMMNTQRNQDFGAVVPQAEMNNFTDAATSLLKTDKEILLGINAMLERQLEDTKIAKDKLGDEAFYLKYGNADKAIIQKIDAIKEVIGTKKKDTNISKEDVSKMTPEERKKFLKEQLKGL